MNTGTDYSFVDHLPADFSTRSLRTDVLIGLTDSPKWLPPKWFYDKVGSELFEDITRLPEYYPTRTERSILLANAAEIIRAAGTRTLIELGSGSSEKTRLLLDAITANTPGTGRYIALDVSETALRSACAALVDAYPQLQVEAMRADFTHQLDLLPAGEARTVAFLGSTIGNFDPAERAAFLGELRASLAADDHFLLGTDLVKSPSILVPAYDDAAGVTAAFNLNVLDVVNQRLDADFDRNAFTHVAIWDADRRWIEMRLRATHSTSVRIAALDLDVSFAAGEEMRTEISAKFTRAGLAREMAAAGFIERGWWADGRDWFALSLWRRS